MNLQRVMKRTIRLMIRASVLLTAVSGRTSCGTSRSVSRSQGGRPSASSQRQPSAPAHLDLSRKMAKPMEALLREADSWIGTNYQYGGNDRGGIDCSALVMRVFDNALNIKLPRTSREQQEYCTPIERVDLREGDLVFFTVRGGSTVGHVGIYVGNDCFIHSSSSRGVIISSLTGRYYIDNYFSAGRVEQYHALLDDRLRPETPAAAPAPNGNMIASAGAAKTDTRKSTAPAPPRTVRVIPAPAPAADVPEQAASVRTAPASVRTAPAPAQAEPADGEASALEELSEFFD